MNLNDRACIRGCVRRDVHFATCTKSADGYDEPDRCKGCAPKPCRDGSLICDSCFGRMRSLLDDVRDLLGRLNAIADPLKAAVLDHVRIRATTTEPPAAVGSDILDARNALSAVAEWAYVDLSTVTNDRDTITWLCENVLDRHKPVDGIREAWSVQDAKDQWGVERESDPTTFVFPDDADDEDATAIHEWYDPLMTLKQASVRVNLTQRAVQKWVEKGVLTPVAKLRENGQVVSYFRASEIDKAAKEMGTRRRNVRHEFASS